MKQPISAGKIKRGRLSREMKKHVKNTTRKGVKFKWDEYCQRSLEKLKSEVEKRTMLCIPNVEDPKQSFQVTVDASKLGYAATLSQEINGERRIVAYFSKAVPPYKRDRGQTRLEFEAMYEALLHWKIFLINTPFMVLTDCRSILTL